MATITNTGGVFTIESTNVGLNSMSLSSKLSSTTPIIPTANASYTTPVGVTANQYMIGTTTYTPNQLDITLDAIDFFINNKVLFAPAKAANAAYILLFEITIREFVWCYTVFPLFSMVYLLAVQPVAKFVLIFSGHSR